jgi:hypothetical protein
MFAFTRKDVDARVVGSALVVSFNGVDLQKTWRADMAAVATATLELKEAGKKFSVIMKKNGVEEDIASFNDRESAAYALNAISNAMLKGDTQVVAAQGGQAMAVMTKIFKGAVVLCLLMVIYILVAPTFLKPSGMLVKSGGNPAIGKGGDIVTPGEPIPADQLFGNNK